MGYVAVDPVVSHKDEGSDFGVSVPDLPPICPQTRNFHVLVTQATKPGCQLSVVRVVSLTQALSCLHYPLDFSVRSCTEVRSNRLN